MFSTVDPYFTIDGISRALDLYYRTSRPFNSLGDQYQIATPGAAIRFGVPFSEVDTVFFGIGAETTADQGHHRRCPMRTSSIATSTAPTAARCR